MNEAFLAKLGWRLLQEPTALWSQTLRHNYGGDRMDCDLFQAKSGASHIWKGIVKCSQVLNGMRWIIGNGCRACFWTDVWVGSRPLCDDLRRTLSANEVLLTVADYWLEGCGWKWGQIGNEIPMERLLQIASEVVRVGEDAEDKLVWGQRTGGAFTVKDAYTSIVDLLQEPQWLGWQRIWKLKTQQRVRIFIWLLARESLMTNYTRWRRHMAVLPICSVCDEEEETVLHAMRDCGAARRIWMLLVPVEYQQKFFSLCLRDWLAWNLSSRHLSLKIEAWGRRFTIAA